MAIIYVNVNATPSYIMNGDSWTHAYTDLQSAIDAASTGDQIWVSAGTYIPTKQTSDGDARSATFSLPDGVEVYGGFAGTETFANDAEQFAVIENRDFATNQTIFSGDLNEDDNSGGSNDDNSYHVVTILGSVAAVIDGVIIQDGNTTVIANPGTSSDGGGIQNSGTLLLRQVVVQNNTSGDDGGGIGNSGTLTIYNSIIDNNTATASSSIFSGGGGLINTTSGTATIINSTLSNNSSFVNGGAIRNDGTFNIIGSTLSGNSAGESGGAIINTVDITNSLAPAELTIQSSTIAKNSATNTSGSGGGSGIANLGNVSIGNSIIAGNLSIADIFNDPQPASSGITSEGYNIVGQGNAASDFSESGDQTGVSDPGLEDLADNGGFTQTHALQANSLALDAGSGAIAISLDEATLGLDLNEDGDTNDSFTTIAQLAFDQRGDSFIRVQDDPNDGDSTKTVDVGSFELQECFLAGTWILTEDGEKPVEELVIGDRLPTLSSQLEPIKWIGCQTYRRATAHPLRSNPIHIKPGALGDNMPQRDLFVSPDHALLVDGLLINAGALTNGLSIVQIQPEEDTFTYYHVELHHHALLFAEGTAAESYLPQKQERSSFDNGDEYAVLYPNQTILSLLPMNYPRVSSKRQLPRFVSKRLEKRARSLYPSSDAQSA